MDCSPPGSSVHGISQTRILEWVAISFFRGSFSPRDWTPISCSGRQILYKAESFTGKFFPWATKEAHIYVYLHVSFIHCCVWHEYYFFIYIYVYYLYINMYLCVCNTHKSMHNPVENCEWNIDHTDSFKSKFLFCDNTL